MTDTALLHAYNAGQQGYEMPQMQQPSNRGNAVVYNAPAPVLFAMPCSTNDWLIPAILSCVFCFWPTGICAIIAAVNARNNFSSGDEEGGRKSAKWARGLTIASIVVGVIFVIIVIILYATVLTATSDAYSDLYSAAKDASDQLNKISNDYGNKNQWPY